MVGVLVAMLAIVAAAILSRAVAWTTTCWIAAIGLGKRALSAARVPAKAR